MSKARGANEVIKMKINQGTRIALLEQAHHHTHQTLDRIEQTLGKMDKRFDHLEQKSDKRFDLLDHKIQVYFQSLDQKLDKNFTYFDNRLNSLDIRVDKVRDESWSQFKWVVGILVGIMSAVITSVILKHLSMLAT